MKCKINNKILINLFKQKFINNIINFQAQLNLHKKST